MIRLAVLDLAGTTVRDDGAVEAAFATAMHEVGEDPDAFIAQVRATMGRSKIEVFRDLFGGDEDRAQEANRRFEAAFGAVVARGDVEPLPGALDAIEALRAAGVKVCLTTGFSPTTCAAIIAALGWHELIDLALAPGDGLRGRPHPDLVLTAVLRLGIDAVQEVAVAGDTVSDLEAGTRAGASVVAGVLTGAHDRAQLAAAPHTHLLASIADLPAVALP